MYYPETKEYRRLTFWKCMAVTTFSYAASKTLTAPLERIKLNFISQPNTQIRRTK